MTGRRGWPPRANRPLHGLAVLVCLLGCRSPGTGVPPTQANTVAAAWQQTLLPSNERDWSPDLAVLPYAEFHGDQVSVQNIRNCAYISDDDYVVQHYDRSFDLLQLESVDFIVVPFKNVPSLAHTMLSFGFAGGEHLCVSVEARLEQGETYSPLRGSLGQYELMYVLADERDVILRRTLHRQTDVYLYRTVAKPDQARDLLRDVLQRVNKLHDQPEFYDTLTNNCTTNIVRHINRLQAGRIPDDVRTLLPGFSDQLAYQVGLLQDAGSFEQTRQRANITQLANRHAEARDFSVCIRR